LASLPPYCINGLCSEPFSPQSLGIQEDPGRTGLFDNIFDKGETARKETAEPPPDRPPSGNSDFL
jgi:hypothetical protein